MLLPAQLYREELKRKMTACWYQPKYKYYFLANYHEIQIGDNADWRRDFVCVYKNEVIGFFSYSYNEVDRSMGNFGLVSFVDNGTILIRDVLKHIVSKEVSDVIKQLSFEICQKHHINLDRWIFCLQCRKCVGRNA